MADRAPSFINDGTAVDEQRARTEILAQAFDKAAGEYFERQVTIEEGLQDAMDKRSKAKWIGGGGVAVGVVLLIIGLTGDIGILSVIGAAIGIGAGLYGYSQYTDAEERIAELEQRQAENTPDGSVSFVSRISMPAYLVQYSNRHMIFDGLDAAPQTTLDLAKIDGDALVEAQDDLETIDGIFQENLSDEHVIDPEVAEQLSPGVMEHRQFEKPITDAIDRMTNIARAVDVDSVSVNIHANDTVSNSVATLYRDDLVTSNGDIPQVETMRSLSESQAVIDDIRGVEQQAVSGDMLEEAKERRERVDEIADRYIDQLETNVETATEHYDHHADIIADSTRKFVCEECLADRVADVDDELNLVQEILSAETGSFGVALSDPDLDQIPTDGEGSFTEQVEADIEAQLPVLSEQVRSAYNDLPDLGRDEGYCVKHQSVETVPVSPDGRLFAEVWRSLYYQFRDPIMDSIEDLEREAEEVRQNKEQKMIDLAQYEQIKDAVERDYHSVKAEHEAAETIERRL